MQIGGPQHSATDDSAEILLLDGAKALARRRGVSLRTLRRQFSSLGITLSDFVCARRAALTMNFLQQPGTRVRDAARALGFSGDVSFVHFVKREFGKTPGALRDELSQEHSHVPPGASEDERAPRGSQT